MNILLYLKVADALRESGLDLIREYIPNSPVYNPEDEPGQYNLPYILHSPVYRPPSPDYTPSAITSVSELDEPEEGAHIKFADPPTSPPPNGDVSMDGSSSGPTQLHTAPVHPSSFIQNPLDHHIPVHISRGIPPEQMSDTDLDEELQHPDHPIEDSAKEERECTNEDEPDIPPLVDASTDEVQTKECPPDPWNDSAFTLQERLNQIR